MSKTESAMAGTEPGWKPVRWKVMAAAFVLCVPAFAAAHADQDCRSDLEKLATRRVAAMSELNTIAKRAKGKLDPITACPKLRVLAATETSFLDYLKKNKDWCSIPDQIVSSIATSQAKSSKFAAQACGLVAQEKKMRAMQAQQAQQAQNGGSMADPIPRLPSGPL